MGIEYYPQAFLEESICIAKERKISRYINDDLQRYYKVSSIDNAKPKTSLSYGLFITII